jgi:membrane dipeptidase
MPHTWFDAHLDLAYLAVNGRDMTRPLDRTMPPHAPAGVTLSEMHTGRVRFALGTIFTEVGGSGPEGYPTGNFDRAHAVGRAQLEVYLTWRDQGLIALDRFDTIRTDPTVGEIRGGMGVAEVIPLPLPARLARIPKSPALHVGILMENADPIRSVDELIWWRDRGLVAIGLAWAKSSRFAGGNTSTDGLSALGKDLVREMDRLGIIHDASHLSDHAFDELCATSSKMIIASHSNSRAIVDPVGTNQRHLTDKQIAEIAKRNGVIGLNLYSKFLVPGAGNPGDAPWPADQRATIAHALAHVDRVCSITGNTRHVGLGSDFDGGFAADRTPQGIDTIAHLDALAEGLRAKPYNWSDDDIRAFTVGNWLRVFA